jgi:hypothetical protein
VTYPFRTVEIIWRRSYTAILVVLAIFGYHLMRTQEALRASLNVCGERLRSPTGGRTAWLRCLANWAMNSGATGGLTLGLVAILGCALAPASAMAQGNLVLTASVTFNQSNYSDQTLRPKVWRQLRTAQGRRNALGAILR